MKFPHLHLIVGSKEYREGLKYALVKKDFTIAANAHILVKHPTSNLFDETFINSLPEKGIPLNNQILKSICLAKVIGIELFGPVLILKSADRSKYPELSFDLPDVDYIKFPNHDKVLFKEEDAMPLMRIAIKPELFLKAAMAIDPEYPFLQMFFVEETKAILIKPKTSSEYFGAVGVVMPMMPS